MGPDTVTDLVPAGFVPFGHAHIGFVTLIGPLYVRHDDGVNTLGWRVQAPHCNAYPMAHGGMTAAFADILTSYVVYANQQPRGEVLTISLTTDFLSAAPLGAWVEGVGKVVTMGSSVAFSTCDIYADGKLIAHASGKFKIRAKARAVA
jgi:uncharacterized protein (TIGR00369 family)